MNEPLSVATSILLAFALPYFVGYFIVGIATIRSRAGSLGAQERVPLPLEGTTAAREVYYLVPALNEERVIDETVASLLRTAAGRVVVVDDGSSDGTAGVARAAAEASGGGARLLVVERRLPEARQGKGAALNAAIGVVAADARSRGLDPQQVVVCVMDADGRLSDGAVEHALAAFDDPRVGAVQLIVRIRNREKWITRIQDVEFWTISATSQFARTHTGTVSLGGNGQFTRLAALESIEGSVWSDSLTEDLDLGLRLYAQGWRITTVPYGFVHQQGIEDYRTLLKQRTRWYQGHMSSARRIPELVRSPRLNEIALLESVSYLLVPWFVVLPWSILQQLVLVAAILQPEAWVLRDVGGSPLTVWGLWALWYVISFSPNLMIGVTYALRTRSVNLWQALLLGHVMIVYNYVGYLAAWCALFRMLRGKTGWSKTPRVAESAPAAAAGVRP